MAAKLDLTPAAGAATSPGATRWAGLALIGLGVVVVVMALTGWAGIPLLGCVVGGAGLTYLSGLDLTLEERAAYGTVIGAAVLATLQLLLALVAGLGLATVLAALLAMLALSALGWRRGARLLASEVDDLAARWRRREPWPLWLLLLACWPFTLVVLGRSYAYTPDGLIAGNVAVYADWAAHLTYAGSFAFGHNFPPQFPVDPGHRMAYPFLIDLLAASLVPLGTSLTSSLVLTSGLLALAFPAVMYLAGVRLIATRGGAAIAVLVFTLSGGLGFVLLFQNIARSGLAVLQQPAPLYTQDATHNLQWLNPVLAWILPQRSVLFGFSLALLVLAMLWVAIGRGAEAGWSPFAFAGLVTGITPLSHLHAYGTIVVMALWWAILSPRREWLAFFAPALVLGVPVVLWMIGGGAATLHVQLWWMANTNGANEGPILFWLANTSLLIPAMAAAFLWRGLLPRSLARYLAPIWLWFLVPNVLVFQPWDWDNTKFFAYWALIGALPVGALIARLLDGRLPARLGAAALAVVLMLSGFLDVTRELDPSVVSAQFTSAAGVQVADWARTHTAPDAVFLVAPVHNDPIPTLAGRRVMVGYAGWLWTYGLADWDQRTNDANAMLRGDSSTPQLLRQYGVQYVVIGPEDSTVSGANPAYFAATEQRVYSDGTYTVYRVR